jgi:hypothetical protein
MRTLAVAAYGCVQRMLSRTTSGAIRCYSPRCFRISPACAGGTHTSARTASLRRSSSAGGLRPVRCAAGAPAAGRTAYGRRAAALPRWKPDGLWACVSAPLHEAVFHQMPMEAPLTTLSAPNPSVVGLRAAAERWRTIGLSHDLADALSLRFTERARASCSPRSSQGIIPVASIPPMVAAVNRQPHRRRTTLQHPQASRCAGCEAKLRSTRLSHGGYLTGCWSSGPDSLPTEQL